MQFVVLLGERSEPHTYELNEDEFYEGKNKCIYLLTNNPLQKDQVQTWEHDAPTNVVVMFYTSMAMICELFWSQL